MLNMVPSDSICRRTDRAAAIPIVQMMINVMRGIKDYSPAKKLSAFPSICRCKRQNKMKSFVIGTWPNAI
jgi:hypothetical protein